MAPKPLRMNRLDRLQLLPGGLWSDGHRAGRPKVFWVEHCWMKMDEVSLVGLHPPDSDLNLFVEENGHPSLSAVPWKTERLRRGNYPWKNHSYVEFTTCLVFG